MGVTSLSRDGIVANQKYSSALAGNDTADIALSSDFLIQEVVLNGSAASVNFNLSGIDPTYKHLQLRYVARTSQSTPYGDVLFRLNGDSGSNYAWHQLRGNGSSVSSSAFTSQAQILLETTGNTATSNNFGAGVTDVLDAFSTSKNTTIRVLIARAESGDNGIFLKSGVWLNTSAVTSLSVSVPSANFLSGSRFSLYGSKG